jgi:hypothetical protein
MMRKGLIAAALCGACVLHAQQPIEPSLQKGWDTIKAEDTYALVKAMVSPEFGGRFSGSPKFALATKWAASKFQAMGLKPMDARNGFLQAYPTPFATVEQGKLDVIQGATHSAAAVPRQFMPMIFSDSGAVKAETVFVGWAIHAPELGYDDYAGVDVKGKIVLCFRGTPDRDPKWVPHDAHRYRMKTAHEQGAVGLVYIQPEVMVNNNSDLIKGFFQALINEDLADQIFKDKGTSVAALKQQMAASKTPVSMPLTAVFDLMVKTTYVANSTGHNVVGYVEGSDPVLRDEFVVVGAHFDAVGEQLGLFFPGADDNGSGSAVVMEAAEAFAKNGVRPKRSVMFVLFGGEETGSTGADFFVAHLPAPVKKVSCLLNFDMEGVGDKARTMMSAPLMATRDLLEKADAGLDLVDNVGETQSVGNRSGDITPFFKTGVPVAAIMSNGRRPAFSYHLPGDALEIVQPALMANIARLTYRYAFYLADR